MVGKGENAGDQHFLLFPQCFQKRSFLGVVKTQDRVVRSYHYQEHSLTAIPDDIILDWYKFRAFADDECDEKGEIYF